MPEGEATLNALSPELGCWKSRCKVTGPGAEDDYCVGVSLGQSRYAIIIVRNATDLGARPLVCAFHHSVSFSSGGRSRTHSLIRTLHSTYVQYTPYARVCVGGTMFFETCAVCVICVTLFRFTRGTRGFPYCILFRG